MSDGKNSDIIVGSDTSSRFGLRSWLSGISRRTLIVAALVATTIGLGATAYYFWPSEEKPRGGYSRDKQTKTDAAVSAATTDPDYALAEATLQKQLQETDDKEKQAEIYRKLASVALQQGQHRKVVEYEKKAAELDESPDNAAAYNIANSLLQEGNKQEALSYYKQALEFYTSQPESYSGRAYYINDIKARIAELER